MKQNFSKIFGLLFLITIVFANCKKGDTGPAGAAGATGANGANGASGPQGPKGDTGVANVIYSQWLDVAFLPDTVHTPTGVGTAFTIDTLGFFTDIIATKLDSVMLATGEIKVYLNLRTAADPVIVPLPYFDIYTNVSLNPSFSLNDIFIYADLDASTFVQNGAKRFQYRYILIPGGVGGIKKSIDWNDYNQVKATLGLSN